MKDEIINELKAYINARQAEAKAKQSNYHTFWGYLTGMSADVKVKAAKKMIRCLEGKNVNEFDVLELDALRDKHLGRIVLRCEQHGILPKQFLLEEESAKLKPRGMWQLNG